MQNPKRPMAEEGDEDEHLQLKRMRSTSDLLVDEHVFIEKIANVVPANMEPGGQESLEPPWTPGHELEDTSADGTALLVMKFGGSSVAGAQHLRRVSDIVRERLSKRPVLVLSAMGKTTNMLLASADNALKSGKVDISKVRKLHEGVLEEFGLPVPASVTEMLQELERILSGVALLKEISDRTSDLVVSFGERLSVRVFSEVFNKLAKSAGSNGDKLVQARPIDSWEVGMLTTSGGGSSNSAFSNCQVVESTYTDLSMNFAPLKQNYSYLPVVTGYIAKDSQGTITTLGRDGSDLTATIIGASVAASEVQIWKDVDGIMTTDPRDVPAAYPVDVLTFEEAAELSTFGAKVVHPAAILPAWMAKLPIRVLNSTAPEQPGTRIVADIRKEKRAGRVAAISSKRDITMVVIRSTRMLGQHGFLAHVFQLFNRFEVSVDVIATSEVTVSLTLDRSYKAVDLEALKKELESVARVEIREKMAMLTLIVSRQDSCSVLRQSFEAFEALKVQVDMVSHGASNVNVTFVIPDNRLLEGAQKIHAVFFEK